MFALSLAYVSCPVQQVTNAITLALCCRAVYVDVHVSGELHEHACQAMGDKEVGWQDKEQERLKCQASGCQAIRWSAYIPGPDHREAAWSEVSTWLQRWCGKHSTSMWGASYRCTSFRISMRCYTPQHHVAINKCLKPMHTQQGMQQACSTQCSAYMYLDHWQQLHCTSQECMQAVQARQSSKNTAGWKLQCS